MTLLVINTSRRVRNQHDFIGPICGVYSVHLTVLVHAIATAVLSRGGGKIVIFLMNCFDLERQRLFLANCGIDRTCVNVHSIEVSALSLL